MNPISTSFTIPLTSAQNFAEGDAPIVANLVDLSCSNACPSAFKSWGNWGSVVLDIEEPNKTPSRGTIMGCQDGTVYLFHPSRRKTRVPDTQQSEQCQARPTSPLRAAGGSHTRSSSNASLAPFKVNSRSRIVSGITTEQVEAPKNYVDFDDEPHKLKDMLMGRNPRGRSSHSDFGDNGNGSDVKSPTDSAKDMLPISPKRGTDPRSLLSATNSPAMTPKQYSTPSSPRDSTLFSVEPSHDLALVCHIVPPRSCLGGAVMSIQLLNGNAVFAILTEAGDIHIFAVNDGRCLSTIHVDTTLLQPPTGIKDREAHYDMWLWNDLQVLSVGESALLLATAAIDANSPSFSTLDAEDNGALDKSRLAIFEVKTNPNIGLSEVGITKLGQWYYDGPAHVVGVHQESDHTSSFFSITSEGQFSVRSLYLLPHALYQGDPHTPDSQGGNLTSLPLPNPFKAMKSRSVENIPTNEDKRDPGRIGLGDEQILGEILPGKPLHGLRTRRVGEAMYGLAWSASELLVFEYQARSLRYMYTIPILGIEDVDWSADRSYTVMFQDRVEFYSLDLVNGDDEHSMGATVSHHGTASKPQQVHIVPSCTHQAMSVPSSSELLMTDVSEGGCRRIICFSGGGDNTANGNSRTLWKAAPSGDVPIPRPHVTSKLPIVLDVIIHGYSDGRVRLSSFAPNCGKPVAGGLTKASDVPLTGYIAGLHSVQNLRTRETFIIGGGDDGSIAVWTLESLKLCARWTLFTTSLAFVLQFQQDKPGPLRGCILCVAQDGTIAVIAIDGFQFLYVIPGSAAPLRRVCLGSDNLLLIYADRRARLWDVKTKEFWRSMGHGKAEELLSQGGWSQLSLQHHSCLPDTVWKSVTTEFLGLDLASTLLFDLEVFITESTATVKKISTSRNQTRAILSTLDQLRSLLSALLTFGLNEEIDQICREKLGIQPSTSSIGFSSGDSIAIYRDNCSRDAWCISGDVSAARALSVTAVLRALSLFEEYLEAANTIMTFYASALGPTVGPFYQPPSLVFFARRWFDASNELRLGARVLFDQAVGRLSDEEANLIAEQWQHHLPCLQPTADRESMSAALALFLCGYLAAEKYSLLSTSALTDISKSIALYLHDEQSLFRVLAIDLCSRGFHVWQHYIDAIEILRQLFTLATSSRKELITAQNVAAQARIAVLQIASSNTALFMTTLGLDILTPLSMDHRRSVMQIVAFLIRKRPLVLEPNLPKLMEAVVKSLDPNSTTHREAVLDTATEIIGYVVKTFPTVDFHMGTQRLAVGSNEGAIIMYDLKTAIRLYVLEGHKKRLSACSFSPDGRRLVTLSLEEGAVLVWKVGSSFSSFFNPGAPPRQGHGGSDPFKTINFNVGEEANMTVSGTLEWVRFEWTADRSVKLKIRESILTFST